MPQCQGFPAPSRLIIVNPHHLPPPRSGAGCRCSMPYQSLLLFPIGIPHWFIPRARTGPKSPPWPLPSFPTAAIHDSCSQHQGFLPGSWQCLDQPSLFLASWCCLEWGNDASGHAHPWSPGHFLPSSQAAPSQVCEAQSLPFLCRVLTMTDRAQGWTPDLWCGHGFMLTAEWVLQVGMWSWLHPHGPGMDVTAREQQTAQPSPAGWNTSMGPAMCFCSHGSLLTPNISSRKMGGKMFLGRI